MGGNNKSFNAAFDKANRKTVFVLFLCGAILATVYVPERLCQALYASDMNKIMFMIIPIASAAIFGTSVFGVMLLSVNAFAFGALIRCFVGIVIQQITSDVRPKAGLLLASLICVPVFFVVSVFGIGFADDLADTSAAHMRRMSFLPMFILSAATMVSVFYFIG